MSTELTRGQRLWQRALNERSSAGVALDRARLLTESWETTDGLPTRVRRAKVFENIVTGIPIYIEDGQLLVGDFASKPGYAEWYPEFSAAWVLKDTASQKSLQVFMKQGVDTDQMRRIAEYWTDKCLENAFFQYADPDKMAEWTAMSEENTYISRHLALLDRLGGYHTVNYEKVIKQGLGGILEEVNQEIKATEVKDDASLNKVNFLKACAIVLKAGIAYARRYAALAREMASKTADARRKQELLKIAEICDWVPEHPARTFYEGVQSLWFTHVLIYLETRSEGESPGRVDQYLYPAFRSDIDSGRLTREGAIELLECLRVKMCTLRQFSNNFFAAGTSGEAQFHNITIGGQTADGRDATNELSFLLLEAALRVKSPHPTISIRYHDKLDEKLALKGLEVVATGVGFPAFFNDKAYIPFFVNDMNIPLEEALGYAIGGCVVPQIPGKIGPGQPILFHFTKCLELALYDGYDPRTKMQIGLHTGKFENFQTFDEVLDAFKKQTHHFSIESAKTMNIQRSLRENMICPMFNDVLIDDCIKKGQGSIGGGGKYQIHYHNGRTMINVVDSLAAIKKCVFDDKTITRQELLEALRDNFVGHERVRKLLLAAPKFGNDDDYVDNLCNDLYQWWRKMAVTLDAGYGVHYLACAYSVGGHVTAGERIGALPSGHAAGVSLADGSLSPDQGSDVTGPTAVINSCSKVDQTHILSTLLNMKFNPSSMKTDEDRRKLLSLIRVYFDNGGKHIQFNIVDKKTLLEARAHPEQHRNLIVRVAGYSAFFTELHPKMQDEIIARTEHNLN